MDPCIVGSASDPDRSTGRRSPSHPAVLTGAMAGFRISEWPFKPCYCQSAPGRSSSRFTPNVRSPPVNNVRNGSSSFHSGAKKGEDTCITWLHIRSIDTND